MEDFSMSKTKSIADLVTELQAENESLQSLKKLFNQACKNEFGYDVKALHDIIIKCERLEKKIYSAESARSAKSE